MAGALKLEAAVAARVPDKVVAVLREILKEGSYVGYSAFLLFAMRFKRRPFVWEGENRKDLLNFYMPWAEERCPDLCAVDGVACVLCNDVALFGDAFTAQDLKPVTDEHPLHEVRHWVAAVAAGVAVHSGMDPLNKFYGPLEHFVLGTVCDGNCGIDVMALMLELPSDAQSRAWIRQELYEFGMGRWNEPWLHDMFVVTQELELEELRAYRSCGHDDPPRASLFARRRFRSGRGTGACWGSARSKCHSSGGPQVANGGEGRWYFDGHRERHARSFAGRTDQSARGV